MEITETKAEWGWEMITLITTTICSSADNVDVGVAETEVKADRKDVDRVGVKADLDLVVDREISNVMKWDVSQALKVRAVDKADPRVDLDLEEDREGRRVDNNPVEDRVDLDLVVDKEDPKADNRVDLDLVVVNKADLVADVDQDARVDHVRPQEAEVHQQEAEVHQLEAEEAEEAEDEADLVEAEEVEVDQVEAEVDAEAVVHKFNLISSVA